MAQKQRVELTRTQRLWIAGVYFNLCTDSPESLKPLTTDINLAMQKSQVPRYVDELSPDRQWVLETN